MWLNKSQICRRTQLICFIMCFTDISFARQFNESNKKKGKRNWLLFRICRVPSVLILSLSLLPSITEKTMAQAFRRFPIISISLKYLRSLAKRDEFPGGSRLVSRSLSNVSLTMGSSALFFVSSTYLSNNQRSRFPAPLYVHFSEDTIETQRYLRHRTVPASRRFYIWNVVRKRIQRKYFPSQSRILSWCLNFLAVHFI